MHGHPPRAASVPRAAFGGDYPPRAFAFVRPLAGTARADEPRTDASEEARCGTGATRAKVRAVFRRREAPSRLDSTHLIRRARTATGDGAPARDARTEPLAPRERETSDLVDLRFPHRPAKGGAFPRRPEVRSTAVRLGEPEDRSPLSLRWASLPRGTCAPWSADALQIERACAFSTSPRCPA